jgi:extracellular elastinolytic metalloproteinase
VAERFLRRHLAALGLSRTDLGSLQLARRAAVPGGAELLGYRQYAGAIPSFDGGVAVLVDASGRVTSVSGAAQPRLSLKSRVPAPTAAQAMRTLMDDVGVKGALRSSGEAASLVAFGEGTSARLGWQLDLRAGPAAHYAAVVDAASGRILYRANRVKSAANDALAGAASRPRTSAAKRAISGRRSVALPANTSPRISTPPTIDSSPWTSSPSASSRRP